MKILKKIVLVFIVMNLLGIGISMVLLSGLGSDSITLLNNGIHNRFEINYTMTGLVYNGTIILCTLFFAREYLGIGSIAYALATGIFIDLYTNVMSFYGWSTSIVLQNVIYFIVGETLMCIGFSILIQCNIGMAPLDALLTQLSKSLNVSYGILKTVQDIIFMIIGILLGGVFGVGSIISVLCTGKIISLINEYMKRLKERASTRPTSCKTHD